MNHHGGPQSCYDPCAPVSHVTCGVSLRGGVERWKMGREGRREGVRVCVGGGREQGVVVEGGLWPCACTCLRCVTLSSLSTLPSSLTCTLSSLPSSLVFPLLFSCLPISSLLSSIFSNFFPLSYLVVPFTWKRRRHREEKWRESRTIMEGHGRFVILVHPCSMR